MHLPKRQKPLGNVGEWHEKRQRDFPDEWLEVPMGVRRTDVHIKDTDIVLEIQHSQIASREVAMREEDYKKHGKNVVWLLDGEGRAYDVQIIERKDENGDVEYVVVSKRLDVPAKFSGCAAVLLDAGDDGVFSIPFEEFRFGIVRVTKKWTWREVADRLKEPGLTLDDELLRPPPVKQYRIVVWQYPPGSGKTYRIMVGILSGAYGFDGYDTVLVLVKPHAVKEVDRKEFEERLEAEKGAYGVEVDSGDDSNAYWYRLTLPDGKQRLVIFATIDSFVWKIGDPSCVSVMDRFESICNTIRDKGPKVSGRRGSITFKGKPFELNGKCKVVIDEATKLSRAYMGALDMIVATCGADALVVGDKMQSVEMEDNMLKRYLDYPHDDPRVTKETSDEIRRFGSELVEFVNSVIRWDEFGLSVPKAAADVKRKTEGCVYIDVLAGVCDNAEAKRVVERTKKDAYEMLLLPNEDLIIFPFPGKTPFAEEVKEVHDEFWKEHLHRDHEYRKKLERERDDEDCRKYLEWFDTTFQREGGLLTKLHYADVGAVDTSTSVMKARIVSIQSSQGDGRRRCMVIGMSEARLKTFTRGKEGLQFWSLVCVALTRAKEQLVLFMEPSYDVLWRRFATTTYMSDSVRMSVEPKFHISKHIPTTATAYDEFDTEMGAKILQACMAAEEAATTSKPLMDYLEHVIRASTYRSVFFLRALEKLVSKGEYKEQFYAKAKVIGKANIRPLDNAKSYFDALRLQTKKNENLGNNDDTARDTPLVIPIRKYDNDGAHFDKICKAAERAKDFLNSFVDNKPNWETLESDALVCIMLHYLMDFEKNGLHMTSRMDVIYDISKVLATDSVSSDKALDHRMFHETVTKAKSRCDEMEHAMPNGKWLMMHRVSHGDKDGKELPFQPFVVMDFVVVTEERVCAIYLRPQVSTLCALDVACTTLFTNRLLRQPVTVGRNGKVNKNDRFCNKEIETHVIDTSTGYMLENLSGGYLKNDQVDEMILECIRERCTQEHNTIAAYVVYHIRKRNNALDMYDAILSKLSHPEYVRSAIKAFENSTLAEYDEVVKELENELETELARYKRRARSPTPLIDPQIP